MLRLASRDARRTRSVKFVPSWTAEISGGLLEKKFLAAAAIYRRPSTDPTGAVDQVNSSVTTNVPGYPPSYNVGVNSANSSLTAILNGGYYGSLTLVGQADTSIVDKVNPPAPSSPVGTFNVSFSDSLQLIASAPNILGVSANMTLRGQGNRAWVLADSATGSGNAATVVQTYTSYINRSRSPGVAMAGNSTTALFAPGLIVADNGAGIAAINTIALTPGSGTIAPGPGGGPTITYSFASGPAGDSINVTATTNVGVLPLAVHNSNGTQSGIRWDVRFDDNINVTTNGNSNANITSTYNAAISS